MSEIVKMQFPAKREYLKAIRLAVSGIACNNQYDVDELEDLKSCVAEACILFLCRQENEFLNLSIECSEELHVKVSGTGSQTICVECTECTDFSEEISKMMIQSLSDHAVFEEEKGILQAVSFNKKPNGRQ